MIARRESDSSSSQAQALRSFASYIERVLKAIKERVISFLYSFKIAENFNESFTLLGVALNLYILHLYFMLQFELVEKINEN